MKSQWMNEAAGVVIGQKDTRGEDTKLLVDVYLTHIRMTGDIILDADNMECFAQLLMEGAQELRSRQRRERAVDSAISKALGL